MKVAIITTTYNRSQSLQLLYEDIVKQKGNHSIIPIVCIDKYTSDYDSVIDYIQTNFSKVVIIKNEQHFGKNNYYKLINQCFETLKQFSFDYSIHLPDDVRLTDNFFQNAFQHYQNIADDKFVCLNLFNDYTRKGKCWTNIPPTKKIFNGVEYTKTGWIDMLFIATRTFYNILEWHIKTPLALFQENGKSSGVGYDISKRIIDKGYSFYQVKNSLLIHLDHPSVMHPQHREKVPLISNHSTDKRIFGVASIKSRIKSLQQTINSIYEQADEIYVYLNDYDEVPNFLNKEKITTYLLNNDLGDAGKFYNVGNVNGWYFSIDDDLIYPPNYSDLMIMNLEMYQRKAVVTYHGRIMHDRKTQSYYHDYKQGFRCLGDVEENTLIHVPGTGVTAFHTSTLKISINDFKVPNMADIWLAKLCSEQNVKVYCLAHKKGFIREAEYNRNESIWNKLHRKDKVQTEIVNQIKWK